MFEEVYGAFVWMLGGFMACQFIICLMAAAVCPWRWLVKAVK